MRAATTTATAIRAAAPMISILVLRLCRAPCPGSSSGFLERPSGSCGKHERMPVQVATPFRRRLDAWRYGEIEQALKPVEIAVKTKVRNPRNMEVCWFFLRPAGHSFAEWIVV